jgi:putative transposase
MSSTGSSRRSGPISAGSATRVSSSSPAAPRSISRPSWDLYSRFVVGWAVSAVNDRHLTLRALDMARQRRCPEAGLLYHSDQGSTYASDDYRARLARHGLVCSMSRRGKCHDNAVMESWFATVKSEEGEHFHSYAHAKAALFDDIEVFYNQRRRHSTLGQISPAECERRAAQAA